MKTGNIRLDKYICDVVCVTRSAAREMIRSGRVDVNGKRELSPEKKIDEKTKVSVDGKALCYKKHVYIMMNKPAGCVTATEDRDHRTVMDLLAENAKKRKLAPVGRLDMDTEGLLLLTDDGDLAHRLLSPSHHVEKQYFARISGKLSENAAELMKSGLVLGDGTKCLPAELYVYSQTEDETEVYITIAEGRYHQVKRMFAALGTHVEYLRRISFGPLVLDKDMALGEYRELSETEMNKLFAAPKYSCGAFEALSAKKAAIFDLDGTLVDSMWLWKGIDEEYLARFGKKNLPDMKRKIEGMSYTETAQFFKETFEIPDDIEKIKADWYEMSVKKYRSEVPLKKGAEGLLSFLKEHRIKMAIATSNGADLVDAVLGALGVRQFFDIVVTACEVGAGKPAPDIYLEAAARLGLNAADCMVFEDIPAGIMAGKAAGMEVCAVEDADSAWLRAEKIALADHYIRDFDELFA